MILSKIIAKNTIFQFLSRVLSAVSLLAVTFLITRNLSKDIWGDFIVVTSFLGLFTIVTDFGINAIFVKEISKKINLIQQYFDNLLSLRLFLSLISIFIALAVLSFLPYSSAVKVGIIFGLIIILLQSIFLSCSAVFQFKLRYDFFAIADILGSLSIIILVYLATYIKAELLTIIIIFIIGNFVKAMIGLAFVHKILGKISLAIDLSVWKILLFFSIPVGLTIVFSQFNANIDKQIIALTDFNDPTKTSVVAAGIYGLSYRIFDFIIALATFGANALYPVLLQKRISDPTQFGIFAKKGIIALFILGVIGSVFGWILTPTLLNIFGDYSESTKSLRILLLGIPLFYVTSLILWINIVLNREKFLPFIYGFATIFNLSVNLAFIPRFGYNFAAWSTLITEVLILGLLFLLLIYDSREATKKV